MIQTNSKEFNERDISSKLFECTSAIVGLSKIIQNLAKQQERFFKQTERYITYVLSYQSTNRVYINDRNNITCQSNMYPADKQLKKDWSQDNLNKNFKKEKEKQKNVEPIGQAQRNLQKFLGIHRDKQQEKEEVDLKFSKTMPLKNVKSLEIDANNLAVVIKTPQNNPLPSVRNFRRFQSLNQIPLQNLSLGQFVLLKNQLQKINQMQNPRNQLILFDYKDNLINIDLTEISANILEAENKLANQNKFGMTDSLKFLFMYELRRWIGNIFNELGRSSYYGYITKNMNKKQMKVYFSRNVLHNFLRIKQKLDGLSSFGKQYSQMLLQNFDKQARKSLGFLKLKYPQQQKSHLSNSTDEMMKSKKRSRGKKQQQYVLKPVPNMLQILQFQNRLSDWRDIKQFINILIRHTDSGYQTFQTNLLSLFVFSTQKNENVSSDFSYEIGSKLLLKTRQFSKQQLNQNGLKIKSNEIMRILIKWIQNLQKILLSEPELDFASLQQSMTNNIMHSIQKSQDQQLGQNKTQLDSFQSQGKSILTACFSKVLNFIMKDYEPIYSYVPRQEYKLNVFSSVSSVGIQNLISQYLYELLRIFQKIKDKISIRPKFQVHDLFRGKCSGSAAQINQVLKNLKNSNIFKMVNIKNRLNTPNKDYSINMTMEGHPFVCELQLVVKGDQSSDKLEYEAKYQNDFNHFLYELERSKFGSLAETINVYMMYSDIPTYFKLDNMNNKRKDKYQLKSSFDQKTSVNSKGQFQIKSDHQFIISKHESTIIYCNYCKTIVSSVNSKKQLEFWKSTNIPNSMTVCSLCILNKMSNEQKKRYWLKQFDNQFVSVDDVNIQRKNDYAIKIKEWQTMVFVIFDKEFQKSWLIIRQFKNLKRTIEELKTYYHRQSKIYILKTSLVPLTIISEGDKTFKDKLIKLSRESFYLQNKLAQKQITYIEKENKIFILQIALTKQSQELEELASVIRRGNSIKRIQTEKNEYEYEPLQKSQKKISRGEQQGRRGSLRVEDIRTQVMDFKSYQQDQKDESEEKQKYIFIQSNYQLDKKPISQNQQPLRRQQIKQSHRVHIYNQQIGYISDKQSNQYVEDTVCCRIKDLRWSHLQSSVIKQLVIQFNWNKGDPDYLLKLNSIKLPNLIVLAVSVQNYPRIRVTYENNATVENGRVLQFNEMPNLSNFSLSIFPNHSEISLNSLNHPNLETISIFANPSVKLDFSNASFPNLVSLSVQKYQNDQISNLFLQLVGFQNQQTLPKLPDLTYFILSKVVLQDTSLKYFKTKNIKQFVFQPNLLNCTKFKVQYPEEKFQNLKVLNVLTTQFHIKNIAYPAILTHLTLSYFTQYDLILQNLFSKQECLLQYLEIKAHHSCQLKLQNVFNFPMTHLKQLRLSNISSFTTNNPFENLQVLRIQKSKITELNLLCLKSQLKKIYFIGNYSLRSIKINTQQIKNLNDYYNNSDPTDFDQMVRRNCPNVVKESQIKNSKAILLNGQSRRMAWTGSPKSIQELS